MNEHVPPISSSPSEVPLERREAFDLPRTDSLLESPLAIELHEVFRQYGSTRALAGISLKVPKGSIFGLVGPNGAGKTTTFGIICGYLRPDAGSVSLFGEGPFKAARHRGRITALPQDAELGRDMPLVEQLTFFARLQGLSRDEARDSVQQALKLADLSDRSTARTKTLSHGMLRRVAIAQSFLGSAELILLDEPTNGLDPRQAHHIRSFIKEQQGRRTVVVSSHNLHEIESICDHVALIHQGRVASEGKMEEMTGKDDSFRIVLGEGPVPLEILKGALPSVDLEWNEMTRTLTFTFTPAAGWEAEDVITAALRNLLGHKARIAAVLRGQSLEQKYLNSTDQR